MLTLASPLTGQPSQAERIISKDRPAIQSGLWIEPFREHTHTHIHAHLSDGKWALALINAESNKKGQHARLLTVVKSAAATYCQDVS